MSAAPALRDAWHLAAATAPAEGLRAARFTGGGNGILATVDADGRRGLLIGSRPDDSLQQTVVAIETASDALGAEIYPFTFDGRNERGLHIWCRRTDIADAFASFSDALVMRLVAGERIHPAFVACLDEFRRLVSGSTVDGAGPALAGLLGELVILSELIAIDPASLDTWSYPARDRHDFRNGHRALEVKASLRSQSGRPVVTISSLDQLDAPAGGSLHLHWLRFERDADGPISVMKLVEAMVPLLDAERAGELRSRILGTAPSPVHLHRFSLQERRCYRVTKEFPRLSTDRLLSGSVDAGVSRVTYELDLSMAGGFECSPGQVNQEFLGSVPQ